MNKAWIAVASAEHVRLGREQGFMQVCHGKADPLRRIHPGDAVIYYSPTERMGGGPRLQAFTAMGQVKAGAPYQVDMGEGFQPFRRDVDWLPTTEVPIARLLERLSFTVGERNWGARFRFGVFQILEADRFTIAQAMGLGGSSGSSTPPSFGIR